VCSTVPGGVGSSGQSGPWRGPAQWDRTGRGHSSLHRPGVKGEGQGHRRALPGSSVSTWLC